MEISIRKRIKYAIQNNKQFSTFISWCCQSETISGLKDTIAQKSGLEKDRAGMATLETGSCLDTLDLYLSYFRRCCHDETCVSN